MPLSKILLIGGSVGLASATAGGIAFYLRPTETIKEHITKSSANSRKFISLVPEAFEFLKAKYSKDGKYKPLKNEKLVAEIIDWCRANENTKFFNESNLDYLSMDNWCFVNTNSLLEQAKQTGKQIIEGDANAEAWKEAWNVYNTKKGTGELMISGNDIQNLNTGDKDSGGPALHKWCKAQDNKKMYDPEGEGNYARYEKWCFKA